MTQTRFATAIAALSARTLEREAEIRSVVIALLTQQHVVLVGPPGTGKSQIANDVSRVFGGLYLFSHLVTRWTSPDEVLGHLSLKGLKEDKYLYVVEDKLPTVELAYLDELFNAPATLLNTLLNILHERTFQGKSVPLVTMIASSNQLPEGLDAASPDVQSSAALYDRILLRHLVRPLQSDRAFAQVVMGTTAPGIPSEVCLQRSELLVAQAGVQAVTINPQVIVALMQLRAELIRSGMTVSDRRWKLALQGPVRATAWLRGATEAEPQDLEVLSNIMWDTPDQIAVVHDAVFGIAWPSVNVARKLEGELMQRLSLLREHERSSTDREGWMSMADDLNTRLMAAMRDLEAIGAAEDPHPEIRRVLFWLRSVQLEVARSIYARTNPTGAARFNLAQFLRETLN